MRLGRTFRNASALCASVPPCLTAIRKRRVASLRGGGNRVHLQQHVLGYRSVPTLLAVVPRLFPSCRPTFSGVPRKTLLRLLVWASVRVLGPRRVEQRSSGGYWAQTRKIEGIKTSNRGLEKGERGGSGGVDLKPIRYASRMRCTAKSTSTVDAVRQSGRTGHLSSTVLFAKISWSRFTLTPAPA